MTTLTYTRQSGGNWAEINLSEADIAQLGVQIVARDDEKILPSQLDKNGKEATLVVHLANMKGDQVTIKSGSSETKAQISVETIQEWEGQESFRIQTPACEWIYHKFGGGFASIIDPEGRDWISFRPYGGSDGIYRGIPNCAYPENVFHPGHHTCKTQTARVGPLRATLITESNDEKWAARWHIYPDHAELAILKFGHPYWLLYEGTPGGKLEEDKDFCVRSDGLKRPLSEKWDEELPSPKWIGFGKEKLNRMLWLYSHAQEHQECRDSFWPMEQNMTVFGFGRVDMNMTMAHAPARFTVGLSGAENTDRLGATIAACANRAALTRS